LDARRGAIVRRAPGEVSAGQVLAANVDLALVTEPLPDPKARRLERFAALASSGGVPVALVLTKSDLTEDGYLTAAQLARRMGVADAVAVSALTGEGMGVVRSLLTPGTTAVLLGASGTGKSTLVNALLGEERQKTNAVRASDARGRHTTVTRELLTLPGGAFLIDTPGIRVAGLWDGTGDSFADVDELAAQCRFADCGHDTEPGCAVRAALDPERIAAWRKLQRELAWVDDRRAASRERERRHKEITRYLRSREG
jgi:ribosome biogenesis GTPase